MTAKPSLFGRLLGTHNLAPSQPLRANFSLIAQEASGKTVFLKTLIKELAHDLPSGLGFGSSDPLQERANIRETMITLQGLRQHGQMTTVHVTDLNFYVYKGTRKTIEVATHEVIGQVLTMTEPDSPAEQLKLYDDYKARLLSSPALLVGIPMPTAHPTEIELERWHDKMRTVRAYLRLALEKRPTNDKVAVALVLFKADVGFADLQEAKAQASDELLKNALRPLVNTLLDSEQVDEAVIAPVTAFGWGNARQLEPKTQQEREDIQNGQRDAEWILPEKASIRPFNIIPLLIFTILAQMGNRLVSAKQDAELVEVCRRLRSDLDQLPRWLVPVKGNLL